MEESERRWLSLCARIEANGDARPPYRDLICRYGERFRTYHNFGHILDCLKQFDTVRSLAVVPDAVELAIWFHDSVYEIRGVDNEERSAALAVDFVTEFCLPENWKKLQYSLVMATKHTGNLVDPDEQLIADIDLAGLGLPEEDFDRYEKLVRAEYESITDPDFLRGRRAILQRFVDRPHIYGTAVFREKYEAQARRNLERSISRAA